MLNADVPNIPAVGAAQDVQGTLQRADFTAGQQVENAIGFPVSGAIDAVTGFVGDVGETLSNIPGQVVDIAQGIPEMVTGAERAVASTELLPAANEMPEMAGFQSLNPFGPAAAVGASTLFTSNDETAQIFKANFPDNPTRQDEKGNWILTSLIDGKDYAIKPGYGPYDTIKVAAGLGVGRIISLVSPIVKAVLGEGALATTAGAALTETLAEAITQGVEKVAGGEFDTGNLALAGAIPLAGGALGAGARRLRGPKPPAVKPPVIKPDVPKTAVVDDIDIVSTKGKGKETISAKSEFGNVTGTIKEDGLHITEAIIDEAERGKGHGTQVYTNLIDDAFDKGVKVFSDETVDPGAVRVYESLKRKGYEVIDNREGTLKDGTAWAKDKPVFEVKPKLSKEGTKGSKPTDIFTESEQVELGKVMRKAQGGDKKAQVRLKEMAKYNKEAADLAEELKYDLPVDVLSDSYQVKSGVGLTRSVSGGDLETKWHKTVTDASERTDELLEESGALMYGDGPSVAGASDKILANLSNQSKDLGDKARPIYKEIELDVPPSSRFDIENTKNALDKLLEGVDIKAATKEEKQLFKMISENETMGYGTLKRIKGDLFSANKKSGKYKDANDLVVASLYDAIKKDEIANVANIGGEVAAKKLKLATDLWKNKKAIDERIVATFGNNADGIMGRKLVSMLKDAAKGGGNEFNDIMKTLSHVPEGLRGETLITAIAEASRATAGAQKSRGGFGFTQYSDLYRGLRKNPSVFAEISKELGPEKSEMLKKIFVLSKRISQSQALVLQTGKANQAFINILGADGLISKVLDSTVGKVATTAAGAGIGGTVGAGVAAGIVNMIKRGGKKNIESAGKLFDDFDFKNLVSSAAISGKPSPSLIKKVAQSKAFKAFAREVDFSPTIDLETWLLAAIRSGRQQINKEKEEK
jgi:hypothetical protein